MTKALLRLLHHNDHLLFVHRFAEFRTTYAKEIAPKDVGQLIAVQRLVMRLGTALLERFFTLAQIFGRFVEV